MVRIKRITKDSTKEWETTKANLSSTKPPAPFTKAPDSLAPFLEILDPSHVYIVHIDRFPGFFKKRIFSVPVALNVSIVALLVWRAYAIIPVYLALFASILGYNSPETIDKASKTWGQLIWIVVWRGLNFMLDFVLVRIILPWPISFFLEQPANPVLWRWRVGFKDEEVVVRESRGWGNVELMQGVKTGEESPFFKTRILPGIEKQYMREKTGYMMMDKNFDLDFYAMIVAEQLIKDKKCQLRHFEKTVLAHHEGLGWLCWQVFKLDEINGEEETRKKIVMLKDRLTAIGKENLFFRWIEIVQYESGKEGGFTPKRQRETLEKVKEAFQEQGVDFEQLIKDVGGLEGTPGMDGIS